MKGFLRKCGNLSINILIHVTAVSIKAGYQWSTTAYRASYLSVYKQFELTSCSKQTVNVACKRTACFTVTNDALFFIVLELSVGMTTEGIEVRSVGNTKVSCTFGWLRNKTIN